MLFPACFSRIPVCRLQLLCCMHSTWIGAAVLYCLCLANTASRPISLLYEKKFCVWHFVSPFGALSFLQTHIVHEWLISTQSFFQEF